jgi:hypothetical protein
MRRQIVKEPHLVAHIQMLDCLADFLNRTHARNFTRNFSDENSVPRAGESVLAIANFRSDGFILLLATKGARESSIK